MSTLTQEWTKKLADWRSSGLSIAAWCRRNAEGYHRFLYWRKRLGGSPAAAPGRFIELTVDPGRSAWSATGSISTWIAGSTPAC